MIITEQKIADDINVLYSYQNGNCLVKIGVDGSKERTWEENPEPKFPESIDLKITNYCSFETKAVCAFCHEKSNPNGKHAEVSNIMAILDGLPPGVEVAIGGGNPLAHPELIDILKQIRRKELIANLTLHETHATMYDGLQIVNYLQEFGLIYGLGISTRNPDSLVFQWLDCKHIVCHAIVGLSSPRDVIHAAKAGKKILVLGYKTYGRGENYFDIHENKIQNGIEEWKFFLTPLLKSGHLSFDNLAIKQLGLQEFVPGIFEERYMGDDGQFTMYVDAVNDEYAVSSTQARHKRNGKTIVDMFSDVRTQSRIIQSYRSLNVIGD